jgi:hypothetical protein
MALVDKVVKQINDDITSGDTTAIHELFEQLLEDDNNLDIIVAYLPEETE